MALVVDTSFLIDYDQGDEAAERLLERLADEGETLIVPVIAATEYMAGMRDPEKALAALSNAAAVQDFTPADAVEAARIARRMFEQGVFPGWTDVMIAGFAKARGDLPVLTGNPRHFSESRTVTYRP